MIIVCKSGRFASSNWNSLLEGGFIFCIRKPLLISYQKEIVALSEVDLIKFNILPHIHAAGNQKGYVRKLLKRYLKMVKLIWWGVGGVTCVTGANILL